MHKALIFNGVVVMACSSFVFLIHGKLARKERDEQQHQTQEAAMMDIHEQNPNSISN
jgi:hypothetical protein